MHIREQLLPGVFLLDCPEYKDVRGSLTKLYHNESLMKEEIEFDIAETFLTRSGGGVLRGMHFQAGESAHDKLVRCLKGCVLDVVVDIRKDSIHFNKPVSIRLNETTPSALLIKKGYAHGFLSLSDDSWMHYCTSTIHCPSLDCGVLWSSIDFDWPIQNPLTSLRDSMHPSILV